ncbi:hypothetical protein [Rhizosaccharibacter radicis]|uniref:DUF4412 domain-containing protein n=1 Tax=Rhizosaccharibacter radicis TaxID=2782605 RepID=A0ABT1VXN2_9PROT|nr:DUF4412 domain-containing protein [Acetobacteraceae bacterium KSS12]
MRFSFVKPVAMPVAMPVGLLLGSMLLGVGVPARPALADAPPLMPTRDVSVLYEVRPDGAPQAQPMHVYFAGNGGLMRMDGPPGPDGNPQGAMILDRDKHLMTIVMNAPRVFMQVPEGQEVRNPFLLDSTMRFTRQQNRTVAGLPCTDWAIATDKGSATACVTADGVVLFEQGVDAEGAKGMLQASKVTYGPVPASIFQPPAGFQRVAHPAMGRGLGQGSGGQPTLGGGTPNAMRPMGPPGGQ